VGSAGGTGGARSIAPTYGTPSSEVLHPCAPRAGSSGPTGRRLPPYRFRLTQPVGTLTRPSLPYVQCRRRVLLRAAPGGGRTLALLFTANLAPAQKVDAGQGIECATHRSTVEDTAGTGY
jgi:hypothetical protein